MTPNTPAGEELKACPFCGSDETSHGFTYAGVLVGHCGCEACDASVSAESEEEAIEKWNRRPAPEPAPQQGEVTQAIKRLRYECSHTNDPDICDIELLLEDHARLASAATPPPSGDAEKGLWAWAHDLRAALKSIDEVLCGMSDRRPKREPQAFVDAMNKIEDISSGALCLKPAISSPVPATPAQGEAE